MDKQFVPDTKEDWFYLIFGTIIIILIVSSTTTFDAQLRSLFSSQTFSVAASEEKIIFDQEDIDFMNQASVTSLGGTAVADERLYCMVIDGNRVTNLRLSDQIYDSSLTSVSGACFDVLGTIDGFTHTQPGFSGALSDEDKRIESDIDYTCIQYDEIVTTVTGNIYGINCWKIENDQFNEIEVVIE